MSSERDVPLRWWGAGIDFVVGIVVFVLVLQLVRQSFVANASIMGSSIEPPTSRAIAEYWLTAGVMFAIVVFGCFVAVVHRRKPAMIAYPIVAVFTLALALLISVPQIDFSRGDTITYEPNPNYCSRTDSENCPGG